MSGKGLTIGANGTPQIAFGASGSAMLELFVKLSRGFDVAEIRRNMDEIVKAASLDAEQIANVFVLTFQTRDCRGGKGERLLFRAMLLRLYSHFPETVIKALPLIQEFGYFKDYEGLFEDIEKSGDPAGYVSLTNALIQVYADKLKEDAAILDKAEADQTEAKGLSLAAKYAPSIVSHSNKKADSSRQRFARLLRNCMFRNASTGKPHPKASEKYRKMVSRLNEALKTVERLMSMQRFDEIEVGRIPSVCLQRGRKAFLFEDKKGALRDEKNEARINLRKRLLAPKNQKKIKGGQLFANEIVSTCMGRSGSVSEAQEIVIDAQWNSLVRTVKEQVDAFAAQAASTGGAKDSEEPVEKPSFDLGNLVALVDVSGSMSGVPMTVSIAMGLIVAELGAPAFRNRVLTFESTPRWHSIVGDNIVQKVKNLAAAPWGGSTNFRGAMLQIIKGVEVVAKQTNAMPQIPDLVVFSDMQFDQAGDDPWETAFQTIQHDFKQLGERLKACGIDIGATVLEPPVITFWNIRSNTTGLVASAHQKNVRLLSGFSQSLMKLLLSGALPAAVEPDEGKAPQIDPLDTLYKAMYDERYDPVREFLSFQTEGALSGYTFSKPSGDEEIPSKKKIKK